MSDEKRKPSAHRRSLSLLFCLCVSLVALECKRDVAGGSAAAARIRIAVVPKGTTHEFWKSVHAGAIKAARELDIDVIWKGALREDDLKGQIDV
ncbi:MAG: hypothetical protein M3O46_02845, partial [Myxococcota bacterium]|nr:hypothetical protein [Myxococcota bacterium]